jgi:hypothetical protein
MEVVKGYTGRRWISEIVFSSLKRVLGEEKISFQRNSNTKNRSRTESNALQ